MSIDRELDKEDVVHIYSEILLIYILKKEQNNAIWSNMDGSRDYYSKWKKNMISLMESTTIKKRKEILKKREKKIKIKMI